MGVRYNITVLADYDTAALGRLGLFILIAEALDTDYGRRRLFKSVIRAVSVVCFGVVRYFIELETLVVLLRLIAVIAFLEGRSLGRG